MSKQLDIFIESLGTLLSPFVIDYNFILCKNIYKNTITKSATQGLPLHHFLRFKPIKKQKR